MNKITEEDRWILAAEILIGAGTAILAHFGKKN